MFKARTPANELLHVALAQDNDVAVARVTSGPELGIEVARIAAHSSAPLTNNEAALLPEGDRDEWVARTVCAKRVVAKGGQGAAKRDHLVNQRQGERLLVGKVWVESRREQDHAIDSKHSAPVLGHRVPAHKLQLETPG